MGKPGVMRTMRRPRQAGSAAQATKERVLGNASVALAVSIRYRISRPTGPEGCGSAGGRRRKRGHVMVSQVPLQCFASLVVERVGQRNGVDVLTIGVVGDRRIDVEENRELLAFSRHQQLLGKTKALN